MIVPFKFYVMTFVENVIDFYLHITSHVSQAFASCTHYTSYSLLNSVHVIECDFGLANQVWKFLEFYANMFDVWEFKDNWWKILILEKLGSKSVFEKYFISYLCILFIKFNALRSFCIKLLWFSKICFFQNFDRLNLFLDRSKLWLKFWSASISFDRCSIDVGSIEAFLIDRT